MATDWVAGARTAVGALALAAVPVVLAAVPLVPLVLLAGRGVGVGLLAATLVGLGGSAVLGPVLVDRRIEGVPVLDPDDGFDELDTPIEEAVARVAADVGVDAPDVTVVRADAANVAVADGYRGSRLVVSTRLGSLPSADRDAALRHALTRLRTREAAFTTAALPGLAAVETVALLATLLVDRRSERAPGDRTVNRIHGYEPARERIPGPVYTAAGLLLWLALLPAWIPAIVGDRLFVSGRRRVADAAVARTGTAEREGLGNAVEFAGDAAGAAEWPPLLDRLSLVSMADNETGRVRGTSRQEARIRLARLRSKRAL